MVWLDKENMIKIGSLAAVVQVRADKMTFTAARAFLSDHVGLGMLQHGPGRIWYDSECKFLGGRFICGVTFGECCENGVAAARRCWPRSCRAQKLLM